MMSLCPVSNPYYEGINQNKVGYTVVLKLAPAEVSYSNRSPGSHHAWYTVLVSGDLIAIQSPVNQVDDYLSTRNAGQHRPCCSSSRQEGVC